MGTIVSPQAGGGAAKEKLDSSEKICGAQFLQGIVREAVSDLQDNGKTLADSDKERLHKLLKNIQENEKKIKNTVRYMDEFSDLSKALGDQSSKIITEANMKSLLDKNRQYISRNARDQLKLISVLSALRNMVSASGIELPVDRGTGSLRPMGPL
jgi:t-SNARE complex subunit (syntaxin)